MSTSNPNNEDKFAPMRRRAYQMLARRINDTGHLSDPSPKELRSLVHELTVYQVELEMENDELRRVQQELETAQESLRELYEFAPVGYFTVSADGLIRQSNFTGAALFGANRRDLLKRRFADGVDNGSLPAFGQFQNEVMRSGLRQSTELRLIRRDRTPFYARLDAVSRHLDVGSAQEYRLTVVDISERVRLERQLRSRDEQYRILVQQITELSVTLDAHGAVLEVDDRIYLLVGRSLPADQTQRIGNLHLFAHPDDSASLTRALARLTTSGEAVDMRLRLRHSDGHWVVTRIKGQFTQDDDGHSRMLGVLTTDV